MSVKNSSSKPARWPSRPQRTPPRPSVKHEPAHHLDAQRRHRLEIGAHLVDVGRDAGVAVPDVAAEVAAVVGPAVDDGPGIVDAGDHSSRTGVTMRPWSAGREKIAGDDPLRGSGRCCRCHGVAVGMWRCVESPPASTGGGTGRRAPRRIAGQLKRRKPNRRRRPRRWRRSRRRPWATSTPSPAAGAFAFWSRPAAPTTPSTTTCSAAPPTTPAWRSRVSSAPGWDRRPPPVAVVFIPTPEDAAGRRPAGRTRRHCRQPAANLRARRPGGVCDADADRHSRTDRHRRRPAAAGQPRRRRRPHDPRAQEQRSSRQPAAAERTAEEDRSAAGPDCRWPTSR